MLDQVHYLTSDGTVEALGTATTVHAKISDLSERLHLVEQRLGLTGLTAAQLLDARAGLSEPTKPPVVREGIAATIALWWHGWRKKRLARQWRRETQRHRRSR